MLPWGPPWSDSLIFSNWEGPGGLRNDPNVPIEDRALRLVLPSIATLSHSFIWITASGLFTVLGIERVPTLVYHLLFSIKWSNSVIINSKVSP